MVKDPIIKEIHQIRTEYAERYDNDLHSICEAARKKQGANGRLVVHATPKLHHHVENNVA